MQERDKVGKLIEWFARAALRHAEAICGMQEEAARIQVEALDRFYDAVRREDGLERFLTLLGSEEAAVSGMAAVYAMREAPERCREHLAELAKRPGLIGFRSKAALERWDLGDWPR